MSTGCPARAPACWATAIQGWWPPAGPGPASWLRRGVEQGAVLESRRTAQLLLVPLKIENPLSLAKSTAGELLTTVWADEEERGKEITSLWFCKVGGDPTQANWVRLA